MIEFIRDLRLIPIALIASVCLLALKTADLILDSAAFFGSDRTAAGTDIKPVVRAKPDSPAIRGIEVVVGRADVQLPGWK